MSATSLLADTLQKGVTLWVEDGELCLETSIGVLTPSLREELAERKGEIVALLGEGKKYTSPSYSQQRLWFIDQLDPQSAAYSHPIALCLSGRLDVAALRWSLDEIVRRHETLRTAFAKMDGRAVQVIVPDASLPLSVVDLRLSKPEQEIQVRQLAEEEAQRPFDLTRGPLVRALLLQLGEAEYVLLLSMHHIISDVWSVGILIREVTLLYKAYSAGKPSPLPELSIQYADYAAWQREWLQGETLEAELGYWKVQLEGAPTVLDLPTDRPRPSHQTYQGDTLDLNLSQDLTDALRGLGQGEACTLFMVLLAAFKVLLHRYTGQEDILVGSPIVNRNQAEIEGLIGFFANTLVLRTRMEDNPSFLEVLRQVRETTLEAYAHQDVPFEMLVDVLKVERDLSRSPLFQVMLVLQNIPMEPLEMPGLTFSPLEVNSRTAMFDLTLSMVETEQGLMGELEYSTDLFDTTTVERIAGHLETLLKSIVADPAQRISDLALLTEAEHQQLQAWNETATAYPEDKCIHELFEEQVERTPDAVAVVACSLTDPECSGEQHLTYGELDRRANQLAHYLQESGVEPEVPVGLCLERSLAAVLGLLGVLKAGGTYVPLDPKHPQERVAFILTDTQTPILLTESRFLASIPNSQPPISKIVCLDRSWEFITGQSKTNLPGETAPESLAYVIYTSGSTGQPKGVLISHRDIASHCRHIQHYYKLTCADRVFQFAPLSFDVSLEQILAPLTVGAGLVLADVEVWLPSDFYGKALDLALTVVDLPPAYWHWLVQDRATAQERMSNEHLRLVIIGGDVMQPKSLHLWWQTPMKDVRLINAYGPTEATITATAFEVASCPEGESIFRWVPIGHPLANRSIYILDGYDNPVPIGIMGQLHIGGTGLARGYLGRQGLTAERFVPDPFGEEPGARLYRTGDLARYLPDGNIEFLGRMDHQVQVRGFRVELGEIETVLAQHPAVRETVALAREDTPGDPSVVLRTGKRLVAYVVGRDSKEPSVRDLREFLGERLPGYMIPAAFVMLDELPLTPNGKVDRRALPPPDGNVLCSEEKYIEPRTLIEEVLAGIWAEVLGLERVGVHDSFFELGGHSLLATQVISRVRTACEAELPVRALFEAQTVAELAERIEQVRQAEGYLPPLPLEPVSRDGGLPLSFAQQRLWFLDQLEPGSATYNMPAALRLAGQLDVAALEQSLDMIVQRHETLRTTFAVRNGQPFQVIAPASGVGLPVIDLQAFPEVEREAEVQQLAARETRQPFDLQAGPLVRVALLRLSEQDHVLVLNMHHIVSDGWSTGILVREVTALYEAFARGKPARLPELPIQYADYAAWQREWLQGETLEAELGYWKAQLEGAPTVLDLPTDRPPPPYQTYRGDTLELSLSQDLTDVLRGLGQGEGSTLFMVLLAALGVMLHRYTGQEDILVGSPIANRNRAEIEGLIGFFANTLVLRTRMEDNPSFLGVLRQVRETTLEAYAHQDVPFEMLVDALKVERDLSRSPLFQVMLVLQNAPMEPLEMPGLTFSPLEAGSGTTKFDLTLSMVETEQGLMGGLEYSTDLFDTTTIERMAGHLETLLESIVANPAQRISDLALLTEVEHQQLQAWNGTATAYPEDKCIHELFEEQVERTPDAVAVVACSSTDPERSGEQHLTYGELNRRANQLAHYLQESGVGSEVLVGTCVERSLEMIVGLVAILKAGAAYVQLDTACPAERLLFMLSDLGAPVVLAQEYLTARLPPSEARIVCLDRDWDEIERASSENPLCSITPEQMAYVSYTSGSTGVPKGVQVPHRGVVRLVKNTNYAHLDREQVFLQLAPIEFDASTLELWGSLTNGGRLVVHPPHTPSLGNLGEIVEREHVSLLWLTAGLFHQMVEQQLPGLSRVRQLLSGGDVLSVPHVQQVLEGLPNANCLINGYGPTENTTFTTFHLMTKREHVGETSISIGRPIANTQVYMLDGHLQPVPVGVVGELYAGGEGLARGYLNQTRLTAERFIPNPFSQEQGKRLYRTGDLARYLPDGNIEFLGRTDRQVKIRGFRIELGEIEAVLAQHPAVQETVALAREDTPGDPSAVLRTGKRLVAYVVASDSKEPSVLDMRGFLGERLPEYMVPAAFVMLEELPLTPNGKIDRRALPAPEGTRPELGQVYVAPRTPGEEALARIWSEVLGLEQVGVYDNFFELGGHSLLATQVVSRVRSAFRVELPVRAMFEAPTVAALGQVVLELQMEKVGEEAYQMLSMIEHLVDE